MSTARPWFRVLCGLLLVSSCGGGGGGGGQGATLVGTLLDAPTIGVSYTSNYGASPGSGTLTGTTDGNGEFNYKSNQTVTFGLQPVNGGAIALGSASPVAPQSGDAIVFVGGLDNGLQVAQVLQSLSHASSTSQIDVSGLTLSATTVTNLSKFILSGGAGFGSAGSYAAMMTTAQSDALQAAPGLTFLYPGGVTAAQAAANLAAAQSSLPPPAAVNVTGLYYFQEIWSVTTGGQTQTSTVLGMTQRLASGGNAGTFASVTASATSTLSPISTGAYTLNGNVLTGSRTGASGTYADTVNLAYSDPSKILYSLASTLNGAPNGTALGTAYRLLSPLAPSVIAGRTLWLGNALFVCGVGAGQQITFAANGQQYATYCSNALSTPQSSGTVTVPAGLSVIQITDGASGTTRLFAVTSNPGLAILTIELGPGDASFNGIIPLIYQ